MSNVCHTNPIDQVIQKGHRIQNGSLIPSKPTRFIHRESRAHHIDKGPQVETSFLHHASDMKSVEDVAFQNRPSLMAFKNHEEESSSWVPQFSSMEINDPLEFSSEYKKLYSGYESQQRQNVSRQQFPITSSMVRKTASNLPSRNMFRQHRQENRNSSTDAFKFDAEFQNLENEIQEVRYEPILQEDESWLDQDQLELQRIATDIVKCCTPPLSSASSTSTVSSIDSKLSESKFIQLMRGISSGDVTLKKEANGDSTSELFSPSNGELVGNGHIPVENQSHQGAYN
ncbi:hypothetical protein N7582_002382 [Saccharomyces uvarum]|uniref:PEX18/PEX21 C-terminal domain-containing protein n=1 Tax=Saccharomyces uvarum TaxID=230603 RepID=A0AA35JIG8_SACUV|nr:hypothetical protein N7582_002382 [Saccharomyces uvarum]CAI4063318.1 hypothetical protein SUVC_07G4620 [Saccharomyces uvarum]